MTAQPLPVLSICFIVTFLFASNLSELLFLSCNCQGMRSFPLNRACVLCKTAWAWYGWCGGFLDKHEKLLRKSPAWVLTEMLAQVTDTNTAWKWSYSDAVQEIREMMTKVSLNGFSCSSHQGILQSQTTCTCPKGLNAKSTHFLHKLFGIFILPRNHLIYPNEITPKCLLSKRALVLHSTDHTDWVNSYLPASGTIRPYSLTKDGR